MSNNIDWIALDNEMKLLFPEIQSILETGFKELMIQVDRKQFWLCSEARLHVSLETKPPRIEVRVLDCAWDRLYGPEILARISEVLATLIGDTAKHFNVRVRRGIKIPGHGWHIDNDWVYTFYNW
jgi:hypothetical protein